MFKKFTNGCVRVVNRWLPDAFLFAIILTIVVFIGALAATGLPVINLERVDKTVETGVIVIMDEDGTVDRTVLHSDSILAGASEFEAKADSAKITIKTSGDKFDAVKTALEEKGYTLTSADVQTKVEKTFGPSILTAWGSSTGFWSLLAFAMQMALVVVFGSAAASSKPMKKVLRAIAGLCHNNMQAIVITTVVSTICCWLNWGFGLVVGALLAKEVVKRVPTVDYPLLIASAYSGFVIWHAGMSGSIPLKLTGAGTTFGGVAYTAEISQTILHPMNLIMCGVILVFMPFVNYAMHPSKEKTVTIDPALLQDEAEKVYPDRKDRTPAEKLEFSKILWAITWIMGFAYIIIYFIQQGKLGISVGNSLNLDIVNMIFLFLGILLHGDLRRYVDAIADAASGAAGILLQFPFYAGIMGLMVAKNAAGVSLAGVISDFFVNISNPITFPMLSFLAAGIVNFFVPSGGGQWTVQGPIMMPGGAKLGIDAGRTAMAIAWGDQWTNMIQPFWALPALAIAKLSARDVMGYLVVVLLFTGIVACLGFLAWGLWF